jgi:hypothetical protein
MINTINENGALTHMKDSASFSIRPTHFGNFGRLLARPVLEARNVALWAFRGIYGLGLVFLSTNNQNEVWFPWRQAQTAMSTQFFIDHGISFVSPRLPVYGPKSLLPFEFPLTQALGAMAASILGIGSFRATRFVAIVFFVLISVPLRSIVLRYRPKALLPILAVYFLTPFGMYWGSVPMIETTATFFGISGVALGISSDKPTKRKLLVVSASFVLCGIVKMTTLPSYLVLYGALTVILGWRTSKRKLNRVALAAIVTAPSLVATAAWSLYTDRLRSRLPMASDLVSSSKHFRDWTFGFAGQRTTGTTWYTIGRRLTDYYSPFAGFGTILQQRQAFLIGVIAALGLIALVIKRDGFLLSVVIASASGAIIFVNLYFVHDYYVFAIHPLLAIVLGSAITSFAATLFQNRSPRKVVAFRLATTIAVLFLMWSSASFYVDDLFRSDRATLYYPPRARADEIRKQIPTGKPVIVFSETMGWNPEFLYWMGHEGWMLSKARENWPKLSETSGLGAIIFDTGFADPAATAYRTKLGFTIEVSPGTWLKA